MAILIHDFRIPVGGMGIRYVKIADGPMPLNGRPAYLWQNGNELMVTTAPAADTKQVILPHMRGQRMAKHLVREWDYLNLNYRGRSDS